MVISRISLRAHTYSPTTIETTHAPIVHVHLCVCVCVCVCVCARARACMRMCVCAGIACLCILRNIWNEKRRREKERQRGIEGRRESARERESEREREERDHSQADGSPSYKKQKKMCQQYSVLPKSRHFLARSTTTYRAAALTQDRQRNARTFITLHRRCAGAVHKRTNAHVHARASASRRVKRRVRRASAKHKEEEMKIGTRRDPC